MYDFNFYTGARSQAKDVGAHYKAIHETAAVIRGMKLEKAENYLDAVIQHKQCVPFRVHTGNIGRKAQAKQFKTTQGLNTIHTNPFLHRVHKFPLFYFNDFY